MNKRNLLVPLGSVAVVAVIALAYYFNPPSDPQEEVLKLSSDQVADLLGIKENKDVQIGDIESGRGGVKIKTISLQGIDRAEVEIQDVEVQIKSTAKLKYAVSLLRLGKVDVIDFETAQHVRGYNLTVDEPGDRFLNKLEEAFTSVKSGGAIKTADLSCEQLKIDRIDYSIRSKESKVASPTRVSIERLTIDQASKNVFGEMGVARVSVGDTVSGTGLKITRVDRTWADQLLALLVDPAARKSERDVQLTSWGDGSEVPTSAKNLIIVGTDTKGLLHIRIFDDRGNRVVDTDETKLPGSEAQSHIEMIKEYLSPRHTRTDSDAYFVRSDVERLVGHTSTRSDTEGWRSAEQVKRVIPFDRIEASEFGIIASRLDDSKEFGAGIIKVSDLRIEVERRSDGQVAGITASVSASVPTEVFTGGTSDLRWGCEEQRIPSCLEHD